MLAKAGIAKALHVKPGKSLLPQYRKILFLMGATTSHQSQKVMDRKAVKAVVEQDGELPPSQVLKVRVRYFTDGMVLGSKEYVNQVFERHRDLFGIKRKSGARSMKGFSKSGMMVLRDLRKDVFT